MRIPQMLFTTAFSVFVLSVSAQWDPATGGIYYNGNVGIGISSPGFAMDILGSDPRYHIKATSNTSTPGLVMKNSSDELASIFIGSSNSWVPGLAGFYTSASNGFAILNHNLGGYTALLTELSSVSGGYASLQSIKSSGTSYGDLIFNAAGGNIGIGTTKPQAKLAVNGDIFAKKIKVTLAPADWPDYVFQNTYRLRPLSEVERYIKKHHHLPEVPSAEAVEKNGLDVGNNQATLLKKIEELTLYVIEQNKNQQAHSQQLHELNQRVGVLQQENEQLKKLIKGGKGK